ncbi:hypothetical protein Trydic_g19294 [Trypoxylus dichotomus]
MILSLRRFLPIPPRGANRVRDAPTDGSSPDDAAFHRRRPRSERKKRSNSSNRWLMSGDERDEQTVCAVGVEKKQFRPFTIFREIISVDKYRTAPLVTY